MRRVVVLGSILVLGLAATAQARELSVSFSSGSFFARQSGYRRIYGSSIPVSLEAGFKLKWGIGISAGLVSIRDRGSAISLDGGEEEYGLKFRRLSIPVSAFYALESGKFEVRFGAGASFNSYAEDWESVDLGFEGNKVSPRFFASVGYAVLPRWSLVGSVVYESIPTGAGSLLGENINLGGFEILAGIAYRIF
ncbi:MAG: hypothetical protein ACYDH0_02515 [Candidatus Aminicenantales bacterium]